ncbi:hypothetical protein [Burkholderia ubonensis]|uniref:hypothetical protein n=1 Tax=Burkholderia ubonensis TaxID=101571 RepID=UPI00075253B0|nr:hypothetical protein [Burkholderia ubonensis]KVP17070.1 hypothetical protein WJ84_01995 [Burkholderia ubonensis]KVP39806.1 hypothetical protein WJ87_06380 [Burkholderia ubonensis]
MLHIPDLRLSTERQFRLSLSLRELLETLDSNQVEAIPGPEEMSVMGLVPDLVLTKEAWPHQDPHWKGHVFFTMTADGDQFEFGSTSLPKGMRVPAGKVFRIDPLELHWLRPDPVVSHRWTALQWVVPLEQEAAFADALAASIGRWNEATFVLPTLG